MELFPNEIMAHTHRSLKSLEINDFTKYLIGWEKNLDEEYQELLFGKKFHTIHY